MRYGLQGSPQLQLKLPFANAKNDTLKLKFCFSKVIVFSEYSYINNIINMYIHSLQVY